VIGKSNRNCWALITQQYVDGVQSLDGTPNLFSSFKKARTALEKEVQILVDKGWNLKLEERSYYANASIYDKETQEVLYEVYVSLISIK